MFTQLGATASTLSKASTIMFRIGTDAHLYDDPDDVSIPPLLDSKYDSEKCEALKRLLALIAQGLDVSEFFPQVVKNVASHSLEVKKLVYLYLLHYAEKRPNEALLSINSFQKDLGDPNPLIRAWALRTLSGIRLHVIAPIVMVAVGKCARDPSVYVRKCAANALPKLHDLRLDSISSSIEEIVGILLNDYSPGVVGAAAAAYAAICPTNHSLIGKNYRRLCEILPDVEEWGQIFLIDILLRYVVARHGLVRESIMFTLHDQKSDVGENSCAVVQNGVVEPNINVFSDLATLVARSYVERPDEYLSRSSFSNKNSADTVDAKFTSCSNDDVKLLLQCTSPLLWSHNSAVVLAAIGLHWIMSPVACLGRIVKLLTFLLRSSESSKYVILCNILVFAKAMPSIFAHHYEDFFVTASDSSPVRGLKLHILSTIMDDSSIASILGELQDYAKDPDRIFAIDSVTAIGLCAQRFPKMSGACVEQLMGLTMHGFSSDHSCSENEELIFIEAILSLKLIIKQDPPRHEKVLVQLIRSLDSVKVPAARALIVWMIGEYNNVGQTIPRIIVIVLKYLARNFCSEDSETKLQILNCVVKVMLNGIAADKWTVQQVGNYVLELAECDLNFDVRDRACFLRKMLSSYLVVEEPENDRNQGDGLLHNFVECIFLKHKIQLPPEPSDYRTYLPGTLSQIVLHAAPGYEPLPRPRIFFEDFGGTSDVGQVSGESDDIASGDDISTSSCSSDYSQNISSDVNESEADSVAGADTGDNLLIQISDIGNTSEITNEGAQSVSNSLGRLELQRSLESWLDKQPSLFSESAPVQDQCRNSSAVIFIRDIGARITHKVYNLLDPTNGNGLKVDYSFSSDVSTIAPKLIGVSIVFENCSTKKFSRLKLVLDDIPRDPYDISESPRPTDVPVLVPMEEIASLEPGEVMKCVVYVCFHHHLLPLKLSIRCDEKNFPVKLRPDIGYFVRPLSMSLNAFVETESSLPGMFECTRSCSFTGHLREQNEENGDFKDKFLVVCENLAVTILSNSNLFLVSVNIPIGTKLNDTSGLCLRFSSEVLSNRVPLLVTITTDGKCMEPLNVSVKVNCEESVFGLNFLNRIVNVLS